MLYCEKINFIVLDAEQNIVLQMFTKYIFVKVSALWSKPRISEEKKTFRPSFFLA